MNNYKDKTDDIKETSGPAFPRQDVVWDMPNGTQTGTEGHPGMSLRQYAAIELRIPDSGIDWLDEMIAKAERRDIAAKAMQAMLKPNTTESEYVIAKEAYIYADAMIAERAKGDR